jgi:hypothetical protein
LICPSRVYVAGGPADPAIVLKSPPSLRFELRSQHGADYLALLLPCEGKAKAIEVARYEWEPFEMTFQGPACDKLPDPPGGRFEIDVQASAALQPLGGDIPPPDPVKRSPDHPRDPQ